MAEEETDLEAAKTAHAEAAAEFAEFDESIPLDNDSRENEEKSPAEEELEKLMEQVRNLKFYVTKNVCLFIYAFPFSIAYPLKTLWCDFKYSFKKLDYTNKLGLSIIIKIFARLL